MKYLLSSAVIAGLALGHVQAAVAAEITLIAPGGIRAAVEQMIPAFEKKTGHKVKATFGSGLGTKAQVTKGDPFDVPIVQPPYPEVIASGNVVVKSETALAYVPVGVAVKQGMPHPDISTSDAMKMLAGGEVEIGLTFVSEIITEPGVEVVGRLPESISTPTRLAGFVGTHAKDPKAAKELLDYLSSAEA